MGVIFTLMRENHANPGLVHAQIPNIYPQNVVGTSYAVNQPP
jgi:hypothetical protein